MNFDQSRRDFLARAGLTAAALPVLIGCRGSILAVEKPSVLERLRANAQPRGTEARGAIDVPDNVSWRTDLHPTPDDGEPMIISGTVYRSDGKTPAPNVLIYFYHTDKYGIYGRLGQPTHGRFRGWMLTDERGRYEFASIRPASYPNSTIAQHVHMTITTLDAKEDSYDSILFEDDKFLSERERNSMPRRGGFNPIVTLRPGKDGIMRATRDIQLMA